MSLLSFYSTNWQDATLNDWSGNVLLPAPSPVIAAGDDCGPVQFIRNKIGRFGV
jgi:hypothetical protein